MLMYEIATVKPPFYDQTHDSNLLFKIGKGFRPSIPDGIPMDYVQLINLCWDNEPHNRPSVEKIRDTVDYLYCETKNSQSEIGARFSDADKICKNFENLILRSTLTQFIQVDLLVNICPNALR
ncbi:hypothetical protein C2G38_2058257 [Gigaspora rosea]|uniref:Protein kinase domain-containing protein n=1 Tax=Gigaspora rosea TaxID=44941 RepID=A0A397WAX2_9GLOM|nr:hypothetical protein C2G38_2058257 [Gigaspora rosea]